jgi:hypothetical protein
MSPFEERASIVSISKPKKYQLMAKFLTFQPEFCPAKLGSRNAILQQFLKKNSP